MAEAEAGADEVAANRELWTQANSEYADEHAYHAWTAEDITWGIFNVPEQQLKRRVTPPGPAYWP